MNGETNMNTNNQTVITPNTVPVTGPVSAPSVPNVNIQTNVNPTPVLPPPIKPKEKKEKKHTIFWIFVIFFLILGIVATYKYMDHQLTQAKYNCTPITKDSKETDLTLDSTLVQSLYHKVQTSIKEDIAQPNFNDEMRLYLAYRQVLEKDKYTSNCQQFDQISMEPYTCKVSNVFTPKAFKEETFKQILKEMYGENIYLPLRNIQLGKTCIVGYQYIASRKEFVQGYCGQQLTTALSVTKTLNKATSTGNTIILTEEVEYHSKGGMEIPSSLKSGMYKYVFRLDMNYNYVLINKTYESKY